MYKVCTLNKIAQEGLDCLTTNYEVIDELQGADAVLVRSAKMHDVEISGSVKAIARAGAGVNNIPHAQYAEKGIVVMNTPGANANAVKELVILGALLASRKVAEGIKWAEGLEKDVAPSVEKGKSQFVGPEIEGKKMGVIGLGAIGVKVANAMQALGMDVIGYDPYLSVNAAWSLSREVTLANSLDEIFVKADYISLHVPLCEATKHMLNSREFEQMKPGVRIINFSRDTLVENTALKEAIRVGKVSKYVTDFPTEELVGEEGIICIPHLGASTPEAEANCAKMAARQIKTYLEEGNIINAVNMPCCEMPWKTAYRITIIHRNVPGMIEHITRVLGQQEINIADMVNKSKAEWAYTIIDTDTQVTSIEMDKISEIDGVVRVRKLEK